MALFRKDNGQSSKKQKEPAWLKSATNLDVLNYKVYYLSFKEKVGYFLLAFIVGAAVGYLFYGDIGLDEYGNPTQITRILNLVIPGITGLISGILFLPIRTNQIIAARYKQLRSQFRDFLENLTTALGAGNNISNAIDLVYKELKVQYSEDAYILNELNAIRKGLDYNVPIEDLLMDFGNRSNIQDIKSFAEVFQICNRKGGNPRDIIANIHKVLSEKMEINEDIETMVASNKMEQSIMIVMPIALIAIIKTSSPDFAQNFSTPAGIIATTIAIVCFVGAYYLGRMILDIKL